MTSIRLSGVRQNNLKNIDVEVPLGSFTVICGPSGSGKSSLAFQTLYAEGQRRYIESLSTYARQFLGKAPKPDLDSIENIPPAIAIEQKNSVKTSRSTVGTSSEVIDYLRLVFEKLSHPHCPRTGQPIESFSSGQATDRIIQEQLGQRGYILAPVPSHGDSPGASTGQGRDDLLKALLKAGYRRIVTIESRDKRTRAVTRAAAARAVAQPVTGSALTIPLAELAGLLKPSQSGGLPSCSALQGDSQSDLNEAQSSAVVIELTEQSTLPNDPFFVVIDRIAVRAEDRSRISDSVANAFQLSQSLRPLDTNSGRAVFLSTAGKALAFTENLSCAKCSFSFTRPSSAFFSFNSPIGACPSCNGFGNILELDPEKVIPDPTLSLKDGALHPFAMPSAGSDRRALFKFCKEESIPIDRPWRSLTVNQREKVWNGHKKFYGVVGLFEYLETKKYKMHVRVFLARYKTGVPCGACKGSRLKPETAMYRIQGRTISELSTLTVDQLLGFVSELKLTPMQQEIATEPFKQLKARLQYLSDVGLGYLTIDRPTRTLSGGEFQRMQLAKQLGTALSQTLYVLDEPTVGLHPRDNDRLIGILKQLNELGNTLVVVEHDPEVIRQATHVIEIGPGSGMYGGEVVFSGPTHNFFHSEESITAPYIGLDDTERSLGADLVPKSGRRVASQKLARQSLAKPTQRGLGALRTDNGLLKLSGASGHNLKNIDLEIPLGKVVCVTGVSGSGKSSLIGQTLYPALARELRIEFEPSLPFSRLEGAELLTGLLFVDQSPIGKSARSNPVTYLKIFDGIRAIFASVPEAKARAYTAGTFSLNVDGGRCPVCKGLGVEVIDMMFMDDVTLICDACDGKKFRTEILEIKYNGKSIYDVLEMTVDEACDFFIAHPSVRKPLWLLKEVGLGYVKLGQSASTLSGGESQRLKIARELQDSQSKSTTRASKRARTSGGKVKQNHILYILDEPTTGLHFREIEMLMKLMHRLVESGHSVLLIEHNLDVIQNSDWIIDLGPEAGESGGQIIAVGTPEDVAVQPQSLTGQYLKRQSRPKLRRESETHARLE